MVATHTNSHFSNIFVFCSATWSKRTAGLISKAPPAIVDELQFSVEFSGTIDQLSGWPA